MWIFTCSCTQPLPSQRGGTHTVHCMCTYMYTCMCSYITYMWNSLLKCVLTDYSCLGHGNLEKEALPTSNWRHPPMTPSYFFNSKDPSQYKLYSTSFCTQPQSQTLLCKSTHTTFDPLSILVAQEGEQGYVLGWWLLLMLTDISSLQGDFCTDRPGTCLIWYRVSSSRHRRLQVRVYIKDL